VFGQLLLSVPVVLTARKGVAVARCLVVKRDTISTEQRNRLVFISCYQELATGKKILAICSL
jgi:hypothetical protein